MKESDSRFKNFVYLLPRVTLWCVCMLYFVITIMVTFDVLTPYLYPLESFRSQAAQAGK